MLHVGSHQLSAAAGPERAVYIEAVVYRSASAVPITANRGPTALPTSATPLWGAPTTSYFTRYDGDPKFDTDVSLHVDYIVALKEAPDGGLRLVGRDTMNAFARDVAN